MPIFPEEATILSIKIRVRPDLKNAFADWQAKLNTVIAAFPGFVSLEILSPSQPDSIEWVVIQRFYSPECVKSWQASKEYKELIDELKVLLGNEGADSIQEEQKAADKLKGGVTEVFITQVSRDKIKAFQTWVAKIHQVEAKFPGFRGVYLQSPGTGEGKNWITLLQFDTPENLDRWLASSERQKVLSESKSFISALESHRVVSSYGGWFSSVAKSGELPPVWKQTMIVLLVLFPIVVFELKYLSPLTAVFNSSVATFIGNAISVTLISWPMMPIAIWFLGWWLSPEGDKRLKTLLGTCVVGVLYLIEIALLWNFLR